MTPEDTGIIRISTGQMYQEVRALTSAMSRVEAKLERIEALASDIHDHETRLREIEGHRLHDQTADHETRLRQLEERRLPHSVVNIMAAAGATAALVWQAVGH